MIEIDGSTGESGGQILRTALSLSAILHKPFKLTNIRAKRPKPGLQAQHLTCVSAVEQITNGRVNGAELGSSEVQFSPGEITPGKYAFDIGTAGSITLLAQCVLPVLLNANANSIVDFSGGTHVSFSPTADYLSGVFLPTIAKLGANAEFTVENTGWFPKGGGKAQLQIRPATLKHLYLTKREVSPPELSISSIYSQLPDSIGKKLVDSAVKRLAPHFCCAAIKQEKRNSLSPGCAVFLKADYANCVAGFSSLGAPRKSSETVANESALAFLEFDKSGACIDERLADQILLYCALAKGESEFTTNELSGHFETNAWVISKFLPDVKINTSAENGVHCVAVKGIA